jgi:hypothetical protein
MHPYPFSCWFAFLLLLFSLVCCKKSSEAIEDKDVKKTYYPDGKIHKEVPFKNGSKNGVSKEYYNNGQVFQEVNYENNLREGWAKRYFENGTLSQETPYKNDKMHGVQKKYRRSKELMAEIPYHEGNVCVGLKEYTIDGKLKKRYPSIVVTPVDRILIDGSYTLEIRLSDGTKGGVEYYEGTLVNGKYIDPTGSKIWNVKNGVGKLVYRVPRGSFLMEEINIIAKMKTVQANYYITHTTYHLAAENRY